ncbi:MAG: Ig-like domain-containing protein, partial [Flavobacteriales bacterium]
LRDVQKELLVSPPMKSPPGVKIRQRTVEVSWNDTLRPASTYIFQFGNAIADLNESNVLSDVSFVFSTGDVLDSLQLAGTVFDAHADKPMASTKVLLFDSLASVFSTSSRPSYFARTNDQGMFNFQYLRSGKYAACALSDENNNNRYDIGEAIDWLEQVEPKAAKDSSIVKFYTSVPRDTAVRSFNYSTDDDGVLRFRVEPWLPSPIVKALSSDSMVQWNVNDTLYAAAYGRCYGSVSTEIRINNNILDTLEIERKATISTAASEQINQTLRHSTPQKIKATDKVIIQSRRPIASIDNSRLQTICDSTILACSSAQVDASACEILFDKKPGKSYRITAFPGWIVDDCGEAGDTLRCVFSVYDNKDLGALRIMIPAEMLVQPHTFTLLDQSKNPVFHINRITETSWVINDLIPGEYTAIIGADQNANGTIEPALLDPLTKTERNYVYPTNIQVRANWELVVDWPWVKED